MHIAQIYTIQEAIWIQNNYVHVYRTINAIIEKQKYILKIYSTCTVNPLYNVCVGPQWFMTLKWICRCNDFMLFRPQDE